MRHLLRSPDARTVFALAAAVGLAACENAPAPPAAAPGPVRVTGP
ncbi:MAG: hypothetical protein ACNA8S_06705 [Deferrisomatales bacterium]